MKADAQSELPVLAKLLTAGTAACIADLATFPLDTAKVRMQIAGESSRAILITADGSLLAMKTGQPGLLQTVVNVVKHEGFKSLYGGLSAGLQRQMCFAGVRLGLYDSVKTIYAGIINGNDGQEHKIGFGIRIAAGITTGAMAVLFAQPTDVVKVRLQAGNLQASAKRYRSTLDAYKTIARTEGLPGLWRGTFPNISRNAIVNVAEIVCYDVIKEHILDSGLMRDGIPCHLSAALAAGLCTTIAANPVDVVKTRYMNSQSGEYRGALDTAYRMLVNEGPQAFYKGFVPSFARLVSWNVVLWVTYEQIKLQAKKF